MKRCSQMPYHMGIKLRIYPDHRTKRIIAVNDGAKRFVYNRLVAMNNERYLLSRACALVPAYRDRLEYIDSILRNPETALPAALKNAAPFLYGDEVDSLTIDNAIKNYRSAWKKFREDHHAGVPTFHRKGYEQSYQTNAHYYKGAETFGESNVRFEDASHLVLPLIGRIRFKGSPKRVKQVMSLTRARIGTVTVMKEADGRYYVSLQIASEEVLFPDLPKTGAVVGIDLNLENFLWDSDGNRVDNPKFRRSMQDKLAKKQRVMSRRARRAKKEHRPLSGSRNYQKTRKATAHLHGRIRARGNDFRHVVSKQYVENQDVIVAEDLKVRNLLKNHRLAMAISEAGWSNFLGKLEAKASMYGKTFIKVPPQGTTQTCSECGHVLTGDEKLSLGDREWVCPACGTYHVRDHNASKVILGRGLASLGL